MLRRTLLGTAAALALVPVQPAGALVVESAVGTFGGTSRARFCEEVSTPGPVVHSCTARVTVTGSTLVPDPLGGCSGTMTVDVTIDSPAIDGRRAPLLVVVARGTGAVSGFWDYNPGYATFAGVLRVAACESPALPDFASDVSYVYYNPYA